MQNLPYLLALHSIDGLGPIRLRAVLDFFKDPKIAWEASGEEFLKIGIYQKTVNLLLDTRKKLDPQKYLEDIQKTGIKWLTIFDENYPALLKQIYDPPTVLYYKGDEEILNTKSIAVVGTRKITGYGKVVTEQFTKRLANASLTIVSGLARGVDSIAHKTTLTEGGKTIAVLGGGLNKIFPPENRNLAEDIIQKGGILISEFPPDHPSLPGNFPSRNRIISGLSVATLVTEAASDSGSLITARLAIEQGREVFAIPGPITSDLSYGPIDLIKEGARAVYDPQEILDELGISQLKSSNLKIQSENLADEEKKVLEVLNNETMHIDEIGRSLGINAAKISATLLKMEIAGLVQNLGNGTYCKS